MTHNARCTLFISIGMHTKPWPILFTDMAWFAVNCLSITNSDDKFTLRLVGFACFPERFPAFGGFLVFHKNFLRRDSTQEIFFVFPLFDASSVTIPSSNAFLHSRSSDCHFSKCLQLILEAPSRIRISSLV